ncbi:hypothetical protein [Nitrosomonas marina]|uniref:PEP-CTERM protein-sorting domain-containing protein n=1 Tax=Nitrosomonas marina TaxID=917 RepID=A0A1H8HJA7_9PROT|nr:hypothetical protein [Nitrosomonas marina]SEN56302.1 hypothetical protein SAMN05216325_12416 [Nitrosomonas marina]
MNNKNIVKTTIATCLLAGSVAAHSANILFAHVDDYGAYVDDGNRIAQFLTNAGHTVTTRFLDAAIYSDYSSFDQVFVYDLYAGTDLNANQVQNYNNIGDWYNGLTNQNLILDGRIISSDVTWTNANGMSSEEAWIQNYAQQLALRGGGLVLGTDHYSFQSGINNINDRIGVGQFSGIFGGYPTSQAVVDPLSPLFVSGLDACRADPSTYCINDNSTTGFVATGLQANGDTLTPGAYHGSNIDAWNFAAVSHNMGSITFGTCGGPGQPSCTVQSPSPLMLLLLGLATFGLFRNRFA